MKNYKTIINWKVLGTVFASVSLIVLVLYNTIQLRLFNFRSDQYRDIWMFLLLAGLFMIFYSGKEKQETIRQEIRKHSLEFSFYISQALLLSMGIAGSLHKSLFQAKDLFFISSVSLISFIVCQEVAINLLIRKKSAISSYRTIVYIGGGITIIIMLLLFLIKLFI